MTYGWVIEVDLTAGRRETTIRGPRGLDVDYMQAEIAAGRFKSFLMRDGDGNDYYTGKIVGDHTGFEPLDDFGGPNAGCTEICYKDDQTGRWVVL